MKGLGKPTESRLEVAKAVRREGEKHLVIERLSWDRKPGCKGDLGRIGDAGGVVFPCRVRPVEGKEMSTAVKNGRLWDN